MRTCPACFFSRGWTHLDANVLGLAVFKNILVRKDGMHHDLVEKIDNDAPHERDCVLAHARLAAKVLDEATNVRSLAAGQGGSGAETQENGHQSKNAPNSQGSVVVGLAGAHVDRVFGNLSRNVKTVGCVLDVIRIDARTRRRTRAASVVKRQRLLNLGLRLHNQLLEHFLSNMRQSEVGAPLQSAPVRVRQVIACEAHKKTGSTHSYGVLLAILGEKRAHEALVDEGGRAAPLAADARLNGRHG